MLAGERSSVIHYQLCGFQGEIFILLNARLRLEIEIDTAMNATLSKMTIKRSFISILVQQVLKIFQVSSHCLRRNCSILPTRPGKIIVEIKNRYPKSRFTYLP